MVGFFRVPPLQQHFNYYTYPILNGTSTTIISFLANLTEFLKISNQTLDTVPFGMVYYKQEVRV